MTDWNVGCCHPTGGPHGRGEPRTCCHVHVEDLPANSEANQGEPIVPAAGWTAQEQALEDEVAEAKAKRQTWTEVAERPKHEHRL